MSGPSSLEARFQYFHVMLSIKNKPSISIFSVSPTTLKESISHYIPHEKCTKCLLLINTHITLVKFLYFSMRT